MTLVAMLVQKGCLFSAATFCQEVFLLANSWWKIMHPEFGDKLIRFKFISPDGQSIKGGAGLRLEPHQSMNQLDEIDLILIPPYLKSIRYPLSEFEQAAAWLRLQHQKGVTIGGMCTGTFVLAQSGLLDHKMATTNWQFARAFRKRFPQVNLQEKEMLTVDDNLICTGASTAILDLCLYILEKYGSHELADNCSKALLIEPNRGSQAPYARFERVQSHNDSVVARAQEWLEEHFSENIVVDALAKEAGLSPRHFQRRFKDATGDSPLTYLQKIRIEVAKEKLTTTKTSFSEITWAVGYEDTNSFRRMFKRHTSLSPKEYRYKFERTSRLQRFK